MNALEKGKRETVDYELLFAIHDKCELSMDYLFGYETEFPNYDNKQASEYTGLNPDTITYLHKLCCDKNAEVSSFSPQMSHEERIKKCLMLDRKKEAEWILKIIEVLLYEKKEEDVSDDNYSLLFDLYMMSVTSPQKIYGIPLEETNKEKEEFLKFFKPRLDPHSISMTDTFGGTHSVDIDKIYRQIWKNNLNDHLDSFIKAVKLLIDKEKKV